MNLRQGELSLGKGNSLRSPKKLQTSSWNWVLSRLYNEDLDGEDDVKYKKLENKPGINHIKLCKAPQENCRGIWLLTLDEILRWKTTIIWNFREIFLKSQLIFKHLLVILFEDYNQALSKPSEKYFLNSLKFHHNPTKKPSHQPYNHSRNHQSDLDWNIQVKLPSFIKIILVQLKSKDQNHSYLFNYQTRILYNAENM